MYFFISTFGLVSIVGVLTWTSEEDLSKNLLFRIVVFRYSFSETMQIFPNSERNMILLSCILKRLKTNLCHLELLDGTIYHNYQNIRFEIYLRFI